MFVCIAVASNSVIDLFSGNYYSLRAEHETAVLYFQRALKLNPNYLSAWTLMGHEYMELKNPKAAIQAYRKAIGKKTLIILSKLRRGYGVCLPGPSCFLI